MCTILKKAHTKARVKRKNASFRGKKIIAHKELRSFVEKALSEHQSPRSISGRLKNHEKHLPYVAKNVIHDFLNSNYGIRREGSRKVGKGALRKESSQIGSLSMSALKSWKVG